MKTLIAKTKKLGKRPRLIRKQKLYVAGDLIKAKIPGVPGKHICIILKDDRRSGHIECIPVCNFTGTKVKSGEYAIDISKYELPDEWFDEKKANSWIRCNDIDCIESFDIEQEKILGNIRNDFNGLWLEVCEAIKNCPISPKLEVACDCEYDVIQKQIDEGLCQPIECGCAT